jgi:hypothetical protein
MEWLFGMLGIIDAMQRKTKKKKKKKHQQQL